MEVGATYTPVEGDWISARNRLIKMPSSSEIPEARLISSLPQRVYLSQDIKYFMTKYAEWLL